MKLAAPFVARRRCALLWEAQRVATGAKPIQ